MRSPSERFNTPVIGIITTKVMTFEVENINSGDKRNHTMQPEVYEVIEETDILYVTNTWYKEYKKQPLVILKQFVDKFEVI